MLHNKLPQLFIIGLSCFVFSGCTTKSKSASTPIPQVENISQNEINLMTYQKMGKGSRLTFILGVLQKDINKCIYISTGQRDIPIIFPNSFKVKNNIISDGNIELEIGQKIMAIGHATSVDNAISTLNIPYYDCLNKKEIVWIYGQ
ncbi:hypothetical protein GCM10025882_21970 [Acinetobacter gyllenbergii]|nr:hypothetical protein [Acinetobacter gyllenbergii]GMA11772.1 hypothetical protein GCM10025882_21970 [Acinetobacter gyllenbergii]